MTKFNRVLSESDADLMGTHLANEIGFDNVTPDLIRIFCLGVDWAEQAVLAELAEQEPVAWRITAKRFCGEFTHDRSVAQHWIESEPERVTPLYAHPQTEMQKPFTPRNAAEMRDFIGMHFGSLRYANPETEKPSDNDWYELSIHDLLSAFSWAGHYDHEGLSTASSAAFISAKDNTPTTTELTISADAKDAVRAIGSYIDSLKGWQLVPKVPTEKMQDAACLTNGTTGDRYKAMLAAAPKYIGDSNE